MCLGSSKEDDYNIPLELGRLLLVFHKDYNLKATAFQLILVDEPSLFLPFAFVSFLPSAATTLVDSCCPFSLVYGFHQSGNLAGLFFFLVLLVDLRRMVLGLGSDVGGFSRDHIRARCSITVGD